MSSSKKRVDSDIKIEQSFSMIAELRQLTHDHEKLSQLKNKNIKVLKASFDADLKKTSPTISKTSTYKKYFDELVELQTESDLLTHLFHQKKQQLMQELNKEQQQQDIELIDRLKEQVNALAIPLYYTSCLLVEYFHSYRSPALEKKHQQTQAEVEAYLLGIAYKNDEFAKSFIKTLAQQAFDKHNFIDLFLKASKFRDTMSSINFKRIYWIYCHLAVNQTIAIGEQIKLINIDSANTVKSDLNTINPALNFISVAFYAARLLLEVGLLLKHTIWPDSQEAEVYWQKRLSREWDKRKINILNNLIWGIVNLVTNYTYAGLPIASQITAAVFMVDIVFAVWARKSAKENYNKSKHSLKTELTRLKLQLKTERDDEEVSRLILRQQFYQEELLVLNKKWQNKNLILKFNIHASFIIMGSYLSSSAPTLALLAPSIAPILTPVFTAIGISMLFHGIYSHNKPLAFLVATGLIAALYLIPPVGLLCSFMISLSAIAVSMSAPELAAVSDAKENYYQFCAKFLKTKDEDITALIKELKGLNHETLIKRIKDKTPITDDNQLAVKQLNTLYLNIYSARQRFILKVIERTIVPLTIVISFAIYWPVAIGLIAAYMSTTLYQAYQKHQEATSEQQKQNALEQNFAEEISKSENHSGLAVFGLFKANTAEENTEIEDFYSPSLPSSDKATR